MEGGNVDYIECDQVGNINQMWVGISDGSGTAKSGSYRSIGNEYGRFAERSDAV